MIKNLDETILNEVRSIAEAFKKRNGNSSLRISNKDFNLWIINELINQRGRIIKVETRQKCTLGSIPVILTLISVAYAIGIL